MRNTRSHKRSSWSVQYSNLKDENQFVGVYYKPDSVDEKEKEKEEKEEEKKEEESKEPKRVRDLTDKEKEKILNKLYYVEQNFVGRDKLHKIAVSKGYDMTRQFVGDWLKKQVLYQLTRPSTGRGKAGTQSLIAQKPYNIVAADLTEFGGFILNIVIDVFSRKAWIDQVDSKKPADIKKSFQKILGEMEEKPKLLLTDNGGEFKNSTMRSFFQNKGINRIFTIPGNPQSNGLIERLNGTVKRRLNRSSMARGGLTMDDITKTINNYNNTVHSSVGMTPNEAIDIDNPEEVIKNTRKASRFNLDVMDDIEEGDKVRLQLEKDKIQKSPINWTEELFTVTNVITPRTKNRQRDPSRPLKYRVKDSKGKEIKGNFHRSQLQKIEEAQNADKATILYEIEKILDTRKRRGKRQLLVKWRNFPESEATWENSENIKEDLGKEKYENLIKDYNKRTKDDESEITLSD